MKLNVLKPNALSGRRAHIWQRISALYLLFFTPYLAWLTLKLPNFNNLYELTQYLIPPFYLLPILVAFCLVVIHSWIGLRDILIDYTPRTRTRFWLLSLQWLLALAVLNVIWLCLRLTDTL